MKAIIGVGIDCNKNQHTVCISDNSGKQYGSLFDINNKVEDIEYLVEKILKRDARTLSRIHLEITPPKTDYSDKEMYDVREIIRLKYKDLRTNLKKKFRRNLCVVFPNFDTLFKDPYAAVPWALLKTCPTPEDVLRLGIKGLSEIMAKASNGQKCQVSPEDVIKLAEESIRCNVADRGTLFGLKLG